MSPDLGRDAIPITARILIVEDEGIVARDLESSLRSMGYTICGTAATGADAVRQAERLGPDLVLMDIRLRGEMDGVESARRIRAQLDVPIVFLTAYADPDTLERAASIGPYAYVLKPFDDRDLQATVIMALCKHRAFADLDRRVQERTAELARTEAQYQRLQSVTELGLFALGTLDMDAVIQRAVDVVHQTLGVDFAKVLELLPDGESMLLRAGVGWSEGLVGTAIVATGRDLRTSSTRHFEPMVFADRRAAQGRLNAAALLADHGVVSGMSVIIHAPGRHGRPFGALGAHQKTARHFTERDVDFLQAVANVIATAIIRAETESRVREVESIAQEQHTRAIIAEEAVAARDEFLSVASHELRTPTAALQLQLEALQDLLAPHAATLDPQIIDKARRARASVAKLISLVEGVLDVSRITLGNLILDQDELDLAAVVREVAMLHEDLARRSGCELHVSAPEPVPGIWDRVRIEQIVTNLLSNAIKFGAGKPVEITLKRTPEAARLTVRDHGQGIDPAHAERILGRFERAVSHRNYGGLGLGLYIVGQIVKAYGGSIDVSSRPGQGAAFAITLPLAAPGGS